jgi:hypothetical protein
MTSSASKDAHTASKKVYNRLKKSNGKRSGGFQQEVEKAS